jgi:hypothetical protein
MRGRQTPACTGGTTSVSSVGFFSRIQHGSFALNGSWKGRMGRQPRAERPSGLLSKAAGISSQIRRRHPKTQGGGAGREHASTELRNLRSRFSLFDATIRVSWNPTAPSAFGESAQRQSLPRCLAKKCPQEVWFRHRVQRWQGARKHKCVSQRIFQHFVVEYA